MLDCTCTLPMKFHRLGFQFFYYRRYGPKRAYEGSYDGLTLSAYARKFKKWKEGELDVFCYFDNDKKACAPHDAVSLIVK